MSAMGHAEDVWLNMGLIKSFKHTDCYMNRISKTIQVLKCDMGAESTDRVPYVDLTKPIEMKSAEEVFRLVEPSVKIVQETTKKRGRPKLQGFAP